LNQIANSMPKSSPDYNEIYARLEKSVRRACPDWLKAQEDDLVQNAMMRVWDIIEKSEGKQELPSSYLWRVAQSAMIDEIRKQRRRQEVSLTDEEGGEVEPPTEVADPEHLALTRQLGDGIKGCLANLMGSRRSAVVLSIQGHSVPEAARLLEWTVKKTENLVYRGLRELRECLVSKGLKP